MDTRAYSAALIAATRHARAGELLAAGAEQERDARSAGLVAAYVRTVKTASAGGTAVQVRSAHYPRTIRGALDRIRRHSGAPG